MENSRNSQKRYYSPDCQVYFIVAKTQNNFPYFKEEIFCALLIEELKLCKEMKKFKLYAFSIMYDHLNLLVQPNEEFNISKVMQSLKTNISRDINYIITSTHYEGDSSSCRLRLRGMINNFRNQFYRNNNSPKFKWQKSFHDHIIRMDSKNNADFKNHYYYTINNHIKHKLPENWKYISINYPDIIDGVYL